MNLNVMGEKEKTVVLVNRAMYLPGEGGYKRTMYLYDMMRNIGHKPILLTSDFNHYKKERRDINEFKKNYPDYSDIVFLRTRTYKKNISFSRRLAETDWSRQVKKWINDNATHIDTVMLSMPDMNTILAIAPICKANDVKMVIDVRDLRPEAFRVLINNELLYRFFLFPMKRKADKAYKTADSLFAVSNEYLERALSVNKTNGFSKVVYIGSDLKRFDEGVIKYSNQINKSKDEFWITYVGTLGESYDLYTLLNAFNDLRNSINKKVKLYIIGQGPEEKNLKKYVSDNNISDVVFTGFLDYEIMAAYLSKSNIAVNAIKKRASQSIINKVSDYFAAGIPVVNGCNSKEQMEMIDSYNVGVNYIPEDSDSLCDAIRTVIDNMDSIDYCSNSRQLAEKRFDRNATYSEIINELYY